MNGIKYAKCELCGKRDEAQNLVLAGGCFTYLCPNCRKTADKVIVRFVTHLRDLPFEVVVQTVMKEVKV
jgi:ribosome-binding protein aMBF1 (putative translation factor)